MKILSGLRFPAINLSLISSMAIALFLLLSNQTALADASVLNTANSGYDVVAYQTENAAKPGTTKHFAYHDGLAYLFSSQENREIFEKNPEKYVPAFGGYCAMGIVLDKKLPIDPEAFYVVDGTTYLNVNKTVQKRWLDDVSGHISQAEENWEELKDVNPATL